MLKNNKIARWIIIPICIALCFLGQFFPVIPGLNHDAMGVLSIFLGSLILWLTIGIDWPSLLCIFSLGFISKLSFGSVLSGSFGNATFIFLLFTFILTYALSKTSLIKRVAIAFIDNKLAKKSGDLFVVLFLSAVLLLGLFISPSVLFVVILPILDEILKIANIEKGDKLAKTLLMGLGFTVSISSGMTPIAHVFPILAMQAAKLDVSIFAYMGMAVPAGLVLFILMLLMFKLLLHPDTSKLTNIDTSSLRKDIAPINKKDIITLVTFVIVLLLWIVPSLTKDALPEVYNKINGYGTAMPPILGVLALFIIRVDDKPILKVDEAFKNVPWPSLLMCASTIILGSALTNADIGIKTYLQNNLGPKLEGLPIIVLLIVFALWAALQTNLSSNMVTATLVATVASGVLVGIEGSISIPSIICVIGMLASFAFATPPSMPHIAIVAGSEHCDTKDVLLYGGLLMILSIVVALLVAYPLGTVLL